MTAWRPLPALDEALGRRVSMRALALLRVLVGPVVLLHLRPFVADAAAGRIYRDTFHEPYAGWYPELPRALYVALLWVGVAAAVAMTIGLATRVSTAVTAGVVVYNLFLSTTHVHNNRAYLAIVLVVLAMAPCGRELSVDAWLRRRRGLPALPPGAPAWPLLLLRFEASVVYGASGLSKLVDPDWFGGTVTWHRVVRVRDQVVASPLPGWAVDVLTDRSFHTYAAKVIVLTEILLAVGLWWRPTRRRDRVGGGPLPRHDPAHRAGRGLLLPGDRRARDLGRARDAGPGARRRPPTARAPPAGGGRAAPRLAGPVPRRGRAGRRRRSPSSTGTAGSSPAPRPVPSH